MRAPCTEARTSLRESLRIFAILQQSKHNFEDLCYRYAERQKKQENINIYPFTQHIKDTSCGNFIKAFVSLFVAKKEINRLSLNEIIDGSALRQLSNHPNLVLHSILYGDEPSYLAHRWKDLFTDISCRLSKWQASSGHSALTAQLLLVEEEQHLPRVFLVSMSWVSILLPQLQPSPPSLPLSYPIGDHKYVLIKHTNDCFQLVQNYISNSSDCDSSAFATMLGTLPTRRNALTLRAWQDSRHSFSSPQGFNKQTMQSFLSFLGRFSRGGEAGFSTSEHEEMFGVRLDECSSSKEIGEGEEADGTLPYWPSVSFRELDDDCIQGSGSRCMAEQLLIDCALPVENEYISHDEFL